MKRRWKGPGFTLLEAMVTLAIMGIVTSAALSAFVAFRRLAQQVEQDSILQESGRISASVLVRELRGAGGVGVPAWASVIVENDCTERGGFPDCRGSDRVTILQGIPTYPGCRVRSTPSDGEVEFDTIRVESEEVCCYKQSASFRRQAAFIVQDQTVLPVVLLGTGTDCLFRYVPIIPGDALLRPLGETPAFLSDGLVGSVAVLADVKTFYIEWDNDDPDGPDSLGTLKMHVELNGDDSLLNERMTVVERVADLQGAVGYDVRGLQETDTGDDAWWPSTPGEVGNALAADATLQPEMAAMAGISLVLAGTTTLDNLRHVQSAWGDARTVPFRTATITERVGLVRE